MKMALSRALAAECSNFLVERLLLLFMSKYYTYVRSGFQHSIGYSAVRKEEKRKEEGRRKKKIERAQSGSLLLHATFIIVLPPPPPPSSFTVRVSVSLLPRVGHDDPLFQRAEHTAVTFPSSGLSTNVFPSPLERYYIMPRNDFH